MILPAAAPRCERRRAGAGPWSAARSVLLAIGFSIGVAPSALARASGAETLPNDRLPHFERLPCAAQEPSPKAERPILLAHAIVVRTSPAQDGVAAGSIGKVDVWYDAGIRDAFAALAVISASGERVDKRDAAIDRADAAHVSVSVNPLGPGKYTVRYRALSADGHLVSGAWDFEVRP
ncbi:copper resistance CopC family protein [Methylosinus sp. RM1]|uniref:copper resistance CopC family protein n=1 Tax=Methylosinus sp. RM1 TaxID=2583817 RepID=UPI001FEF46D0|nr:copper resistance CopC family protein [Methylosinus sp. RM1]